MHSLHIIAEGVQQVIHGREQGMKYLVKQPCINGAEQIVKNPKQNSGWETENRYCHGERAKSVAYSLPSVAGGQSGTDTSKDSKTGKYAVRQKEIGRHKQDASQYISRGAVFDSL